MTNYFLNVANHLDIRNSFKFFQIRTKLLIIDHSGLVIVRMKSDTAYHVKISVRTKGISALYVSNRGNGESNGTHRACHKQYENISYGK